MPRSVHFRAWKRPQRTSFAVLHALSCASPGCRCVYVCMFLFCFFCIARFRGGDAASPTPVGFRASFSAASPPIGRVPCVGLWRTRAAVASGQGGRAQAARATLAVEPIRRMDPRVRSDGDEGLSPDRRCSLPARDRIDPMYRTDRVSSLRERREAGRSAIGAAAAEATRRDRRAWTPGTG